MALQTNSHQKWQRLNSPLVWATVAVVVGTALLIMSGRIPSFKPHLFSVEGFQELVERVGPWGPIVYMGLLIISVVVSQIPGAPLAIAAGNLWGPLAAGLYTIAGGFLGAMLAYLFGRYLGHPFFKTLTGKNITISPKLATKPLGWIIFFSRLVPFLSFDLVSYGAGIAGLSMPIYASATLVGMIPSTLFLTYIGGTVQFGHQQTILVAALLLVLLVGIPFVLFQSAGNSLNKMIHIE